MQRIDHASDAPSLLGLLDARGTLLDVAPVSRFVADIARFTPAHAWMSTRYDAFSGVPGPAFRRSTWPIRASAGP